jgi:hypothetical protein
MTASSRENFIPVNKSELTAHLQKKLPGKREQKEFRQFCTLVSAIFHFKYHALLESLKNLYVPFDPDGERYMVSLQSLSDEQNREEEIVRLVEELLAAGNYIEITQDDVMKAFTGVSPWGIQLDINFDSYKHYEIYYKGKRRDTFEKRILFRKLKYDFDVYSRVFFLFRLKEEAAGESDNSLRADKIYLKIFKNVPQLDMEMLFPNMKIHITWIDKAKVIIPLIAGGISSIYKIISYVMIKGNPVRLWTQVGFWTLVGSFFFFALKSFMSYKNTVEKYLKTLATNLYFQNLDNNSGVLACLTDEAEEQESREVILAFYFLLTESEKKHTIQSLVERIEEFFRDDFSLEIDFEVNDAIRKLKDLSLIEKKGRSFKVAPITNALRILDKQWDGFFTFNR